MKDELKRFKIWFLVSVSIAGAALTVFVSKVYLHTGFECQVHKVLGLDCPGCGVTRMILALLNMDFYQAFRYNPFMFVTMFILFIVYIWQSIVYIKKNKMLKHLDTFFIIYAVLLISFGIMRNTDTFSWLKPTIV